MKGVLKYNLSDPEDVEKFEVALKSVDLFLVLFYTDEYLRQQTKYGHSFRSIDEALESVRTFLSEQMSSKNLSFDMLS